MTRVSKRFGWKNDTTRLGLPGLPQTGTTPGTTTTPGRFEGSPGSPKRVVSGEHLPFLSVPGPPGVQDLDWSDGRHGRRNFHVPGTVKHHTRDGGLEWEKSQQQFHYTGIMMVFHKKGFCLTLSSRSSIHLQTVFQNTCLGDRRRVRRTVRHAKRPTLCGLSCTDKGKESKTATWTRTGTKRNRPPTLRRSVGSQLDWSRNQARSGIGSKVRPLLRSMSVWVRT